MWQTQTLPAVTRGKHSISDHTSFKYSKEELNAICLSWSSNTFCQSRRESTWMGAGETAFYIHDSVFSGGDCQLTPACLALFLQRVGSKQRKETRTSTNTVCGEECDRCSSLLLLRNQRSSSQTDALLLHNGQNLVYNESVAEHLLLFFKPKMFFCSSGDTWLQSDFKCGPLFGESLTDLKPLWGLMGAVWFLLPWTL